MQDSTVYATTDNSNKDSNQVFHTDPGCQYVRQMKTMGKWVKEMTLQEAHSIGRTRECSRCREHGSLETDAY